MLKNLLPSIVLTLSLLLTGCGETADSDTENVVEHETTESAKSSEVVSPENAQEADSVAETLAPEDVKLTQATWDEILSAAKSHHGKIVVLDVWSTSCPPCLREFHNLVELSQKYPNQVVCLSCSTDFVGISSKPPEYYEERVRKFLSQQDAKFDNYLCNEPADEIFLKIDLASIPAVYIFGEDGELVERFDNDTQKYGDEFTYVDHVLPKLNSLLKPTENQD